MVFLRVAGKARLKAESIQKQREALSIYHCPSIIWTEAAAVKEQTYGINFFLFGGFDSPNPAVGGFQGTKRAIKRATAGETKRTYVGNSPSAIILYMDALDIRTVSGGFYFGPSYYYAALVHGKQANGATLDGSVHGADLNSLIMKYNFLGGAKIVNSDGTTAGIQ